MRQFSVAQSARNQTVGEKQVARQDGGGELRTFTRSYPKQGALPMAQSITIPGSSGTAKICNPIGVAALGLLPVYLWIYWYRINREMADFGRANNTDACGTSPGKSLLAITLGAFIIVPAILSMITTHKRIVACQQIAGRAPNEGWLALVLYLVFSPAWLAYMQAGLNGVWEQQQQQS